MSNGLALVSVWRRWLRTIWKASPALMYSMHLATPASNAAGSKLERYGRVTSPTGATSVSCKSATPC